MAAKLRDEEGQLREQLQSEKEKWERDKVREKSTVSEEDVAEIVASWTGIPVRRLAKEESERLLNLEEELHRRVVSQDEAVAAVARSIRRARAGLKDPKRPIGSYLSRAHRGWQNRIGQSTSRIAIWR